jgi:glycerophosphoryl diester phosphodiesterase
MNISFDYNEMKNFISHTGKYKIVNIKTYILVPGNWYERYREEEVDMEVAYLIDDIESEKWIFEERYRRRKDDYYMFTIESTFYREYKSKILNLLYK